MLPRKAPKIASSADAGAPVEGRDYISNLPDGVLQHILSFLPARDVVRTCVLAKRWRHMWKSTTVLRFVCGRRKEPKSMKEIAEFVAQLLRRCIRGGGMPLDTCEFRLVEKDKLGMSRVMHWIRIALQCKVRVLQLNCARKYKGITTLDSHPFFITQYLNKLELQEVYDRMPTRFLDFSCCPNLEDLEIVDCNLVYPLLISSESLKRLTIRCCNFGQQRRLPICAPNLVSLWLEVGTGRIPSLQWMPYLLTAVIRIIHGFDLDTLDSDDDNNQSILLQGLSEVQNLVLISDDPDMFIFRRDLEFCSSFNKLKSLLLDKYWCEPANFSALACLLKLSPVLEKLTIQLDSVVYNFECYCCVVETTERIIIVVSGLIWAKSLHLLQGPKHEVEIKLNCKPLEMSAAISQHLKTVEVKCQVYDERVRNVLTFLSKLNIWFQFGG